MKELIPYGILLATSSRKEEMKESELPSVGGMLITILIGLAVMVLSGYTLVEYTVMGKFWFDDPYVRLKARELRDARNDYTHVSLYEGETELVAAYNELKEIRSTVTLSEIQSFTSEESDILNEVDDILKGESIWHHPKGVEKNFWDL